MNSRALPASELALVAIALAISLSHVQSASFSGKSYTDSKKCATACPSNTDRECPPGERCYASVPCSSTPVSSSTRSSCGSSYTDSLKCGVACPSNTDRECPAGERCYASIPCTASTGDSGSTGSSGDFVVSKANFDSMFPNKIPFYTYSAFVSAANSYPAFANTGTLDQKKREAAAFLANIAHESGNLRYVREINTANYNSYCSAQTATANGFTSNCFKNGKRFQYYGRGPIQLSWNFNYLAAGKNLGIDLLHNPDRVATDSTVAWQTALWFWMTQTGAGRMTSHNAMNANPRPGFGETIRSINGALECNGKNPGTVTTRVNYYTQFTSILETSVGPGKLRC